MMNLFSGGGLSRMAVFGLGIMPFITSSIILQLLQVVIPKLQALQDQGEAGVKKINQYTRYVTVVLALLQSTGLVFLFHSGRRPRAFPTSSRAGTFTAPNVLLIILTLTAGTAMVMWLGELITQRGVGNGMSIIIFTSVISAPAGRGQRDPADQHGPLRDRADPGRWPSSWRSCSWTRGSGASRSSTRSASWAAG